MAYSKEQIAALNKLAGYSNVTNNIATPSPNGQGLYRQAVSPFPDAISNFELQKYQAAQVNARTQPTAPRQQIVTPQTASTVAQPNIPTRLANVQNYYANNSELLRAARAIQNSPITAKVGNAASSLNDKFNSLGSAAGRVAGVFAIAATVANYKNNPTTENGLRAGLAALTVATAGVPYVNAAMFFLNLGVAAYDVSQAFKSPQNLKGGIAQNGSLGGQSVGITYNVLVQANFSQGQPQYSWGFNAGFSVSDLQPQRKPFVGAILGTRYQVVSDGRVTDVYLLTSQGEVYYGYFFNSGETASISILQVVREDGQPDNQPNGQFIPVPYDGSERPDLGQVVQDNFDQVQGKLDLLQQIAAANNLDLQTIKDLVSLPRNNNNAQPLALAANPIAAIPSPLPVPKTANPTALPSPNIGVTPSVGSPSPAITPNKIPSATNDNIVDRLRQQIKETQALADKQQVKVTPQTQSQNERFKQSDCKFSCENLAKCFVDVKVLIFDGCNPENGTAKTKEITIQALPKDVEKTKATFKELLDIRSRECSLADRVLTVPDYWQVRVGQRPQAVVLYREFVNGKFTDSYYSQSIPHYDKPKGAKPNLTQWSKGEYSAIYLCKDNSKIQVYASSEAEAKRVINELSSSINPRFRGDVVKYGKRMGIKKTTVKPVRLDFFSTGQTKLSPDWSVNL